VVGDEVDDVGDDVVEKRKGMSKFTNPLLECSERESISKISQMNVSKSKLENLVKRLELDKDIKIFDFDNEKDFLLYSEEVSKKIKLPNIGILHYAILLNGYSEIEDIKYVMRTIYPEIKNDIFNKIMGDMGNKYDGIQYLIRKKRLYRDYKSIEENDKTIYDSGFDASYIWENKIKNIQVFNLDKITEMV
jgi:hypothetical protein